MAKQKIKPVKQISNWSLVQLQIIYHELWRLRWPRERVYADISDLINPDMRRWFMRSDPDHAGVSPNTGILRYDTTAEESSNKCADGLLGYYIQRDQPWFRFEFADEKDNENASGYLQQSERQMYKQLARSNFYDETRLFLRSLLDYGTAIMWRRENVAEGVPSYKTLHLGRVYIDDNQWGDVDVLLQDFWLTPQNAVAEFGYDNLPPQIKTAYDLNETRRWKFMEFTFPKGKFDLDMKETLPWTDIIVPECRIYEPVRVGGFESKPFYAARYARDYDGGPWGVSAPGMLQLANIKMLNAQVKDRTRLAQRIANPPLKATEGLYGRLVRTPGATNYLPAGEDYSVEAVHGNLNDLQGDINERRQMIQAAYHNDFFLVLTNNIEKITHSTATGVEGLMGEKAALLSAFSGRLGFEFLEPVIEDLYRTELFAGRIAPPPDHLSGKEAKIVFISPLFQMQRQHLLLNANKAALIEIGNLVQMQLAAGQPGDILDNFDLSNLARDIAKTYNMRADVVRDIVDVQKIRQGRMMAAQQQAQMQQKELESRMMLERAKSVAAVSKSTGTAPLPGSGEAEQQAKGNAGLGLGSAPVGAQQ